jgi:prevent-host-death family protein
VKEISATEASRNFSKLLDEVEHGRDFSITRGGKVIASGDRRRFEAPADHYRRQGEAVRPSRPRR